MERQRIFAMETLERREMLTASSATMALAVEVAAQFAVNQTPRIQLGNAALPGTAADDGLDQIEILWQTVRAGDGDQDAFVVEIRDAESDVGEWRASEPIESIDTQTETRTVHSALFRGLQWNHAYEYRVVHLRAGETLNEYLTTFRTRLQPGSGEEFSFAAYGDSAILDERLQGFRAVQRTISSSDAAFSVLLGDNIYDSGTHQEADARFSPELNPEAARWIASHVDYLAIGNHDFYSSGAASLDSFSMPLPVAGHNAFAEPPEGETLEFFGSFDYGDVHFVTFDSNVAEQGRGADRDARIAAQVDYLVANLDASDARWKIVYMHHPVVGSVKLSLYPDTNYSEELITRLNEAGVDLIMSGDSHTYAWSYPLQGWNDANHNGEISYDEVVYDDRSTYEFEQGGGPIHLISGVGGKNLRNDAFGQPFMAQTHSTHASTLPLEYGFARVNVTRQQLTVQYISAENGWIVGDENQNGLRDPNEHGFAEFMIRANGTSPTMDFNSDGRLDDADLNLLCAAVLGESVEARFDVNGDQSIDRLDHQQYVGSVLSTTVGDANLDQFVNSADLVLVFQAGHYETDLPSTVGWREGDWNCDGLFTSADLVAVFQLGVYRV